MTDTPAVLVEPDHCSVITIGGKDYELVLTTKATKEIAKRFGGLEKLGDEILSTENFEAAIEQVVWLIALLANQAILIHNLQNPADKKPLLSEDEIELLTVPGDLASYREALAAAMIKGTHREIISEPDPKEQVAQ